MHEAKLHDENCFVTMTYDAEHLPPDGSLVKSHFQKFMKRLRHHAGKPGIKFLQAGEYGEKFKRPHYHAIIFGYDVPDRAVWKVSNDIPLYSSSTLDAIWGHGFTSVGDVTWESAAYVARYTMKKINGPLAEKIDEKTGLTPYERVHLQTGEILEVLPEYSTMSRGGKDGRGLAYEWFQQYKRDIYPEDRCVVNGYEQRPPRYYDQLWEETDPISMEVIKEKRMQEMEKHQADNTPARLRQKEQVKMAQINQLPRGDLS